MLGLKCTTNVLPIKSGSHISLVFSLCGSLRKSSSYCIVSPLILTFDQCHKKLSVGFGKSSD